MGVVVAEFESFKEQFRDEREIQDTITQKKQTRRVLGNVGKGTDAMWNWKYTMRPCTTASCKKLYTPYSNHLYAFYRTPLLSTNFLPLQTLCPGCAKTEVEGFENKIKEEWGSRCEWETLEWNVWFKNAMHERMMELEYWIKAQERVVRQNSSVRWMGRLEGEMECMEKAGEVAREGRKSVIRRWFSSTEA